MKLNKPRLSARADFIKSKIPMVNSPTLRMSKNLLSLPIAEEELPMKKNSSNFLKPGIVINESIPIEGNNVIKINIENVDEKPRLRANSKKKKTLSKAQSFAEKDILKNRLKKKLKQENDQPIQLTKLVLPKIEKKAHRMVGTPDYMAPEVLRGEGLANPVLDWWSVGKLYILKEKKI